MHLNSSLEDNKTDSNFSFARILNERETDWRTNEPTNIQQDEKSIKNYQKIAFLGNSIKYRILI